MGKIQREEIDPFNFNYYCLICCNEIVARTRNLKPPGILDDLLTVLSNYMKWNEVGIVGKQFHFQSEIFPFCDTCIPTIESLFELNEQILNLSRRIGQLCVNISSDILLSRSKCERIRYKLRNSGSRKKNEGRKSSETCQFDVEKVCSYRDVIYKRFTASVPLVPLKKSVVHAKKVYVKIDTSGKVSQENNKVSDTKVNVSTNFAESKVGVGERQDSSTKARVPGDGFDLLGVAVTKKSHNVRKKDMLPEEDLSSLEKSNPDILKPKDIQGLVCNDSEDQYDNPKDDQCEDDDYNPVSPAALEESDVELQEVGGSNASNISDSDVKKSSRPRPIRRKTRKIMKQSVGKLGDRVRAIDSTHFIFDEKFPFERMEHGSWKCGTCGIHFTRKRNMDLHLLSYCIESRKRYQFQELPENCFKYGGHVFQKLGEHQFSCTECENIAETKELAMGHIRSRHIIHKDANKYKSRQLEELTDGKMMYRGFIFQKFGDKKFKCAECFRVSETQKAAMGHIRNFHFRASQTGNLELVELEPNRFRFGDAHEFEVISDDSFRCLTCGDMHFKSRKASLDHVIKCHIPDRATEIRKFGIKSFVEIRPNVYMYADKYEVIKTGDDYKCPECSYKTCKKLNMWRHLCYRHLNRYRFKCDKCEKRFPVLFELDQHKKTVHANEKVVCEACGKTYPSNFRLKTHIHITHAEKKNLCQFCGKSYSVPSLLKMHLKVHTGIMDNSVVCELCGKQMPKRSLKGHMASHDDPQFACTDCNKKYYSEKTLQLHILTHGGAKPHSCKRCGKTFAWKSALKYHNWRFHSEHTAELDKKPIKRRRPGSGPFPCDICGKGFYEKRGVVGHKARYHSELTDELDRQLKEKLSKRRKTGGRVDANSGDPGIFYNESEEEEFQED